VSRRRPSIVTHLQHSIPTGARLLVAVSGGRDSAVLLHALARVQRLLKLHLEVCHVDHKLRDSSSADAEFVQRICQRYEVDCHVVQLSARPARANMEAWARNERYASFSRIMKKRRLSCVVTAHNANDVAETLLIRLFANKELNSIDRVDSSRGCLRPLLGVSRAQIDEYATKHAIEYVDDPSNEDTRIVRNRIRHKVLPLLVAEFDSSIVWSLAERAGSLDADCEALQWTADQVVDELGALRFQSRSWLARASKRLVGLPSALQWRVIERIFQPVVGFALGERRSIAALALFLEKSPRVQLTRGVVISRGAAGLELLNSVPPVRG
jgi:tRNA(Ile)-lysidine synthase